MSDDQPDNTADGPLENDPSDLGTAARGSPTAAWPSARPVPSLDVLSTVPAVATPSDAFRPAAPPATTVSAGPSATSESPREPSTPTDPPPERPQHARRRRNRRIVVWSSVALLLLVAVSAGLLAAQRIDRPLSRPSVATGPLTASAVPGSAPVLPWPGGGQAAVEVPALGYAQQSGPEQPVPIASLTKMTTALVVLRDHPVPPGGSGPTVTITPDEAAQFGVDLFNDETNIPLNAGETLTELQLLEALLNQSADDAAYTLAAWDAGSQQAFVAKMNALAMSLGAVHSHYVDASGFNPQSVSTAADTLRIAAEGMRIPTFASVAGMSTVNLPGVGTVRNIIGAIGTDGIVGVKSGYTSQASGCMVLAGFRSIDGRSVLVLASALGQREPPPSPPPSNGTSPAPAPTPGEPSPSIPTSTTAPYSAIEAKYPLRYTEPIVEHLLDDMEAGIVLVPVVSAGKTLGSASTEWGGTRRVVPVETVHGASLLGVPGQRVVATMVSKAQTGPEGSAPVGTVRFTLGPQVVAVPLRLVRPVPDPGWWWKVLHN